MQENSLQAGQRLQGNPLESHLRTFVTSLFEDGYADATVHDKLSLLDRLGQWLRRTGLAVTHLDERLVRAFVKHRQRVQRGDLKTLQQFLDYLRELGVVPAQEPAPL
jgi:site-specific recombinase XerD